MIQTKNNIQIFIYAEPMDMRKAINGLSVFVLDVLNKEPLSGNLFIFFNKAKDKIKILYWDRNGFVLFYKRLEKIKFKIPKILGQELEITKEQLSWLLAGLDFIILNEFPELNYCNKY